MSCVNVGMNGCMGMEDRSHTAVVRRYRRSMLMQDKTFISLVCLSCCEDTDRTLPLAPLGSLMIEASNRLSRFYRTISQQPLRRLVVGHSVPTHLSTNTYSSSKFSTSGSPFAALLRFSTSYSFCINSSVFLFSRRSAAMPSTSCGI